MCHYLLRYSNFLLKLTERVFLIRRVCFNDIMKPTKQMATLPDAAMIRISKKIILKGRTILLVVLRIHTYFNANINKLVSNSCNRIHGIMRKFGEKNRQYKSSNWHSRVGCASSRSNIKVLPSHKNQSGEINS